MKLYKLSQGSTFENIKHFIYITNEYGVPSAEFVDAFIDQFGKVILIGNFTIEEYHCKILDELWEFVAEDCKSNNVEYNKNYGSLFYSVLSTKAVNKIKEGYEQSEWNTLKIEDKLKLLKDFIENFDKIYNENSITWKAEFEKMFINTSNQTEQSSESSEETPSEETTPSISVKNYELRESSYNRIGKYLNYNDKPLGKIISKTKIEVDESIFDIGKYIAQNNIDTDKIKFGTKIRFETLYKEI